MTVVRLSVPSSILLGSLAIAIAIYLGLRARAPSDRAAEPTAPERTEAEPAAAKPAGAERTEVGPSPGSGREPSQGGATVPPRPAVGDDQLRAEVVALVETAKPRWKAACWDTADPATRTAGRYVSVLAFDAEGGLDVSGITEIRGASDPGVAQCLRVQVNPFTISAPGRLVTFEIPFDMP